MATIPHEMRFQCQKLMVFTSSVATLSHDGGSPFARNEVRASKTVGGSNPSVRKDVRVSKIRCLCDFIPASATFARNEARVSKTVV